MRSANVDIFHQTVALSFEQVLKSIGPGVKDTVFFFLGKRQISKYDISSRFADVEKVLVEIFGAGGNAMIIAMFLKVCDEYSMSLDLSSAQSHTERLEQLLERVLFDRRLPKHYHNTLDTVSFEDRSGTLAPWTD